MKHRILWLSLLLGGCTSWVGDTADPAPDPAEVPSSSPQVPPVHLVVQDRAFPSLESLVTFRQQACQRPEEERDRMLRDYREKTTDESVLRTLMLATCAPERTPGLLANSLVEARSLERSPPGFPAFLDLLAAEVQAYSLLERRLRQTQQKLEDMIEGIRAIEAEMGLPADAERSP